MAPITPIPMCPPIGPPIGPPSIGPPSIGRGGGDIPIMLDMALHATEPGGGEREVAR